MRTQRSLCACAGILLLSLLLLVGCGSSSGPAKDGKKRKPDIILYSEADDKRAGAEAAKEVPQSIGLVDDPALTRYVARVGNRLAQHAPAVPHEGGPVGVSVPARCGVPPGIKVPAQQNVI